MREQYLYEISYRWPGMSPTTKLCDLGVEVEVGKHIKVDGLWWRVERVEAPKLGETHRGKVTAVAAEP